MLLKNELLKCMNCCFGNNSSNVKAKKNTITIIFRAHNKRYKKTSLIVGGNSHWNTDNLILHPLWLQSYFLTVLKIYIFFFCYHSFTCYQ